MTSSRRYTSRYNQRAGGAKRPEEALSVASINASGTRRASASHTKLGHKSNFTNTSRRGFAHSKQKRMLETVSKGK